MSLVIAGALIIVGFLLLIKGADWMVSGSSSLAKKNNISDLAIGLTIVAFGTSAPELVVNSIASYAYQSDIVFGNVIGSNNFNLFVILGIVGLIFPITVQATTVWKEIPISLGAIFIVLILANGFFFQDEYVLSRIEGLILFLLFILFLFYVYKQLKADETQMAVTEERASKIEIYGYIAIGLVGLIVGGKLVVDNAIEVAINFGVSKKVIGLTIIAAGTSLPELVTSVVAAFKKNSDIAIGNIIGSNIFNILLILPISSFINPIDYNIDFNTDIYLLLGGTVFLFIAMFTGEKKKLDRWESGILLMVFICYTIYLMGKEI